MMMERDGRVLLRICRIEVRWSGERERERMEMEILLVVFFFLFCREAIMMYEDIFFYLHNTLLLFSLL